VYVAGRVKTINEKIYYNVDKLHQAISINQQISFKYFEYIVDKKKRYRNDGSKYTASPYAKEVFSMFGGEVASLRVLFDNSLLGVVIDRFGKKHYNSKIR